MANYTKAVNFSSKDLLPTGDADKIVKGTELNTEFSNIQTAVNSKLDANNGALTGTTTAVAITATGITVTNLAATNFTLGGVDYGPLLLGYKNDAETAETNAAASETAAGISETNAAASETAAGISETNAAASETAAAASETAAGLSETAAAASETAAGLSETAAAASETAAGVSETNAAASETAAGISETNAAASETAAGLSETAAEAAETSAISAKNAAESARDSTLAAFDSFDDRYLGAKASDPTVDNDGDALVGGSLYYNTTSEAMKVYTGSVWVDAYVDSGDFVPKAGGSFTGNVGFGGKLTFEAEYAETTYTLTGTTPALDPANGTIQEWTLTANSTPTDSLSDGESLSLQIDDGTAYTITWPTTLWIDGSAPELDTTNDTVVQLWKVGSTLYGALIGVAS